MRHIPGVYITETERGRGVFTARAIGLKDTIEVCPVIVLPETEKALIHKTALHDYYFIWPAGGIVIALGMGSIYNHSATPNAEVIFDVENDEIIIECIKDIAPGDEILIDYTGGSKEIELWFDVV